MKNIIREVSAYFLGFVVFVCILPLSMWLAAGQPEMSGLKVIVLCIFAAAGIALSVWTIVYMRIVGKGNPFDVYGHEIASRTKNLMTEGPYSLCRNPMMTGMLIYWTGIQLALLSWKAAVVFLIMLIAMYFQIISEEKRLQADFGEAYLEYARKTFRFLPVKKK